MPILLLIHHRPSAGHLVVLDANAVFVFFLQVDGAAQAPAVNVSPKALLNNVVLTLAVLQNVMDSRTKQRPNHFTGVCLNELPVLALKLYDPRTVEQLRC